MSALKRSESTTTDSNQHASSFKFLDFVPSISGMQLDKWGSYCNTCNIINHIWFRCIHLLFLFWSTINQWISKKQAKRNLKKWIDDLNYYISHIVMKIKKINNIRYKIYDDDNISHQFVWVEFIFLILLFKHDTRISLLGIKTANGYLEWPYLAQWTAQLSLKLLQLL